MADSTSPSDRAPEILSLDQPLGCECESNGLKVQVSAADFLLLYCSRCCYILAGRPILAQSGISGVERITLSAEEAAQVRQAVGIGRDGPLSDALSRMLACTLPPALRVAQQRFGQRPELYKELRSALYGADEPLRLLTLTLIARMPEVPTQLRASALHAIQMTLLHGPFSESVQLGLMALYNLSKYDQKLRSEVEHVVGRLREQTGEAAELTRRIGDAVLSAMDRVSVAQKERFAGNRDRLAALLAENDEAAGRQLLLQSFPEDNLEDPGAALLARMELCEAAAKTLPQGAARREASRILLGWALEYAESYAALFSKGAEKLSRGVAVTRLRDRLRQLGSPR